MTLFNPPFGGAKLSPEDRALVDAIPGKVDHSLATAENDFLVGSATPGTFVKKTLAQVKVILEIVDPLVYKGAIDCTLNPNYPAADAGYVYFVSHAGKIGGASGITVDAGDKLVCKTDSSASGDHATVGANWAIVQGNLEYETSTGEIKMNGTVSVGTSAKVPRADHVHASDTAKANTVSATENNIILAGTGGNFKDGGARATGFNLAVGTTSGTVAAGNDSRFADGFNRAPLTQAVNMTEAASGSTGIQVLHNAKYKNPTNDFTWRGIVSMPSLLPTTNYIMYYDIATDGPKVTGVVIFIHTNGQLQVHLYRNDSGANLSFLLASSFISANKLTEIVCVVTRETASVAGSVVVYVNGVAVYTNSISAAATVSIDGSATVRFLGTGSMRNAGILKAVNIFNCALSAAEVASLHTNGVAFADIGASQTELIPGTSSTLMTKADWTYAGEDGTHILTDTVNGMRYQSDTTTPQLYFSKSGLLTQGKKYKLIVNVYSITSGTLKEDRHIGELGLVVGNNIYEFTAANDQFFFTRSSTNVDLVIGYMKLISVGCTLDLSPEGIQPAPGQWLDSSGNGNHAMQPAAGSSLMRPKRDFEVRWTNTWAGTHESQYIGGFNQAVLPVNAYIESIIGVISGATIEDVIIGDGSDTDRFVALTDGLVAGTVSFTLVNRVSDGTNRKLTVDPDANFTGSISFIIKGVIL